MDEYTPYRRQLQSHEDAQAVAMEKALQPKRPWLLGEFSAKNIYSVSSLLRLEAMLKKPDQDVAAALKAQQEEDEHAR